MSTMLLIRSYNSLYKIIQEGTRLKEKYDGCTSLVVAIENALNSKKVS